MNDEMIETLAMQIIRPPRSNYRLEHMGPSKFPLGKWIIERTDLTIKNKRDMNLQCSLYEPTPRPAEKLPCVIYLHGNASSRLEALSVAPLVLTTGTTLLAVDLSGSGMSDGEYISLGYHEKDDVVCLVEYLKKRDKTSKIALWGRSMGAATALMYVGESNEVDDIVKGLVVDSPFASLDELANDIIATLPVPALARKAILHYGVKKADAIIREKAGFEIGDLQPARAAKNCHLPVLMVHGKDDTFILPKHSEKCFHEYAGEKKRIIMVAGAHDGERPQWGQDHIYVFLQHLLIAGTSIPNNNNQQQQQQQNSILPLSLGEMWKERGNGEVKQGKWEEASEWYIKAVDYLVGEVKEGREESRRGEEVVEGEGEGMMKRWFGGLFCGQPRQDSPSRPPQKATETDKLLAILYSNLSLCYMKLNKNEEALEAASNCVKHNPDFIRGYCRKAKAHHTLEQYEAAKLTAQEGLVLDPTNTDLLETKNSAEKLCSPSPPPPIKEKEKKEKGKKKEKTQK